MPSTSPALASSDIPFNRGVLKSRTRRNAVEFGQFVASGNSLRLMGCVADNRVDDRLFAERRAVCVQHRTSGHHDGSLVAYRKDLIDLMRDEHYADSPFDRYLPHGAKQLLRMAPVDRGRRLVEQQEARLAIEIGDDLDHLLFRMRQVADPRERIDDQTVGRQEFSRIFNHAGVVLQPIASLFAAQE